MHSERLAATASKMKRSSLHMLTAIFRRAENHDDNAQHLLDIWNSQTPETHSEVTKMIAIASDHLKFFAGSDPAYDSLAWQKRIDAAIAAILRVGGDDPFTRLYAEIVVLAMLNVIRSSLSRHLAVGDMKLLICYRKAMNYAQRWWTKITKAFRRQASMKERNQVVD